MHRTLSNLLSAGFLVLALAMTSVLGVTALHAQENGQGRGQGQGQGQHGPQAQAQGNRPARASFPRSEARGDNSHNSLSDSVRRVQQREPGVRVLSAERVPFDGRDINRIKYVDENGRVKYMDDAGNNRRRSVPRNDDAQSQTPPARDDNPSQP